MTAFVSSAARAVAGRACCAEGVALRCPRRAGSRRAARPGRTRVAMVFTGIVEEIGTVRDIERREDAGASVSIEAATTLEGVSLGDSVSVNGSCLTVTALTEHAFSFDMAPETLRRTNLGDLHTGSTVNLERSLAANGRFGGHVVQGHVDHTGVIERIQLEGESIWFTIGCPRELMRYIVPKGYIAIDGTSLTVCNVFDDAFTFMMVRFTQDKVVVAKKKEGDRVNLEVDITGKYIEKLLQSRPS